MDFTRAARRTKHWKASALRWRTRARLRSERETKFLSRPIVSRRIRLFTAITHRTIDSIPKNAFKVARLTVSYHAKSLVFSYAETCFSIWAHRTSTTAFAEAERARPFAWTIKACLSSKQTMQGKADRSATAF
uniref:Uncharacterized protein n=1 Tax=Trichuris muris TaxID=70415 RepID=A0A5S6Q3F8_TRIMR